MSTSPREPIRPRRRHFAAGNDFEFETVACTDIPHTSIEAGALDVVFVVGLVIFLSFESVGQHRDDLREWSGSTSFPSANSAPLTCTDDQRYDWFQDNDSSLRVLTPHGCVYLCSKTQTIFVCFGLPATFSAKHHLEQQTYDSPSSPILHRDHIST
jgi:hypothetical protein